MNEFEKPFIGAWSLRDYRITHLDVGKEEYPFGEKAEGHILYTAEGIMSATIMKPNRTLHSADRAARLAFKEKLEATGIENLTSAERTIVLTYLESAYGFIGYCGSFQADGEQVHHRVQQAIFPNFVGTTATRHYRFEGDELHLTAEALGFRDALIWQRLPQAVGT